jgi:hypothetical protein
MTLAAILVASIAAGVWLLTSIGTAGEGPLTGLLGRLGSSFGTLEQRVRGRLRGSTRSDSLRWFAGTRGDTARLRRPERMLLGAYDGGIPQTLEGVITLERALGTVFPLIQIYTAWGDKPEHQFPVVSRMPHQRFMMA